MNPLSCMTVQELLSAYHDGELPSETHAAVANHLAACAACAEKRAGYQRLTQLAAHLREYEPPGAWEELEVRLEEPLPLARSAWRAWLSRPANLAAVAAVVLLAVSLVAFGGRTRWRNPGDHLAINFSRYLTDFAHSPATAQDSLLANYRGRKTDFSDAARLVGYAPVAQNPPPGYTIETVYVLDMPCCRCPQVVLQRTDGGRLMVFEHAFDQPVWFGDRPAIQTSCCGRPTRIVESDRATLAATWRSAERHLTIVGARDLHELARVVAHFERLGGGLPESL